jgi:DNA-binding transcriptional regulator YhcF (GntR family)
MRFLIDRTNSLPPQLQLRDQIKLSIAVGRLRPGDMLPSVRDLERDLGLGKNTVWRVYQGLEKAGLLVLQQGKGALVRADLTVVESKGKLEECERICARALKEIQRAKIHPSSFLRYFQQYLIKSKEQFPEVIFAECNKTEAELFSRQISDVWGVEIEGVLLDDLRAAISRRVGKASRRAKVITNIYHVDEVRALLKGRDAEVIGLEFRWDQRMVKDVVNVESPGKVLFIFADADKHRYGKLIVDEFRSMTHDQKIEMHLKGFSEVGDVNRLARSRKYNLVVISNRIWHRIPAEIKKLPLVARPTMQIDPSSLEQARARVGLVW